MFSRLGARSRVHMTKTAAAHRAQPDRGDAMDVGISIVVVVAVILAIWGVVVGIYALSSFSSTDGGHVAVIRNGGPLDNTKIRQILPVSSGRTYIGIMSSEHDYPTSQRFFTIDSSGNGDSDEVIQVPTADGVEVGIEGQVLFTLNTSSTHDYSVLRQFDNNYGTRNFKCANGSSKAVYDGDAGFSCFLEQVVGQIIKNDLRSAIGDLRCADLVASCSLVQNSNAQLDQSKVGAGNVNLSKIEQDIGTSLQQDLNQSMNGNYLKVDRFNLAKVDLPQGVQNAINQVQEQSASVSQAQAQQKRQLIESETRLKQAQIDAQANEKRQEGYNKCPTCGQIDIVKALPQSITVYAPGNSNVAIPTK